MLGQNTLRQAMAAAKRFNHAFSPYLRPQRRMVSGALLALVFGTLLRILEPWPLKFILDRITNTDPEHSKVSIAWINALDAQTLILFAAISFVLLASCRAASHYLATMGFALAGSRALTLIRSALFAHLQRLSLRFHEQARGGDLVIRMISDIGKIQEVAVTAAMPMLGNIAILIGLFSVMFWLDTELTLMALLLLPALSIATWTRGKKIHGAAKQSRKREGAMAATAAESLTAIKTVQSLSLDGHFNAAFSGENQASLKEGLKTRRLSVGLERGVDVLVAMVSALVLGFGAHRVLNQSLSPGELLVFMSYLKTVFRPLRDMAKYGARIAKAAAASERVLDIFETEVDIADQTDAMPAPVLSGDIVFKQVDFQYRAHLPLLQQFDLEIKAHTHVALVGPSGSGKSTLSHLLLRLYDPQQGQVCVNGLDVKTLQVASYRQQVSVVLQDTLLFASSIHDNIQFGLEDVAPERIIAAAKLANAHDFIQQLPEGYATHLGERGVTLSTGQRQRIAIARAAMLNTPILILDEPATGLDQKNEKIVMQALYRLAKGRTTLHITHRLEAAQHADRILFLREGVILEDGTHQQLMALNGQYAAFTRTGAAHVAA